MLNLDRGSICVSLRELSDLELQKQLWLSDGSNSQDVSSFVEAVEQLFTDTGLLDSLLLGETGFGEEAENHLKSLDVLLRKVDARQAPIGIINDPKMEQVRALAKRILNMLG
jgi:hypothetical protein